MMRTDDGIWRRPGTPPGVLDQNQPDYASQLAKANGLQGTPPGHLESVYNVSLQLDDYTAPEFWWLRRGQLGLWAGFATAIAGQTGWVGIQGAVGMLTVVRRIILTNPTAVAQKVFVGLTTVTPSAGAYFPCPVRDTRGSPGLATQCATTGGVRASAAVTPPGTPMRINVPAGSTVVIDTPFVLTGALFLSAQCQTANADFEANFEFAERPILPSEL